MAAAVRPHEVDELQTRIDDEAAAGRPLRPSDLQELGLLVKDLDEGLVDFPALRGDEEVLLCWRLGRGRGRLLAHARRRVRRTKAPTIE
jgi:hypothetical protein